MLLTVTVRLFTRRPEVKKSTLLLVAFVIATSSFLNAQDLVGTKTSFHCTCGSITVERFDPQDTGPHEVVMLLHGADGPGGGWRKSGIVQALTSEGYSVLVPYYFECGGAWGSEDHDKKFSTYLAALDEVSQYLDKQYAVIPGRLALVGFSLGAYLVIGLADEAYRNAPNSGSPKIKAVVEFYGGMPNIDMEHTTSLPPILILHGMLDQVVPVDRAYELRRILARRNVPYKFKIYSHEGHGFHHSAQVDANEEAVLFLRTFLPH